MIVCRIYISAWTLEWIEVFVLVESTIAEGAKSASSGTYNKRDTVFKGIQRVSWVQLMLGPSPPSLLCFCLAHTRFRVALFLFIFDPAKWAS